MTDGNTLGLATHGQSGIKVTAQLDGRRCDGHTLITCGSSFAAIDVDLGNEGRESRRYLIGLLLVTARATLVTNTAEWLLQESRKVEIAACLGSRQITIGLVAKRFAEAIRLATTTLLDSRGRFQGSPKDGEVILLLATSRRVGQAEGGEGIVEGGEVVLGSLGVAASIDTSITDAPASEEGGGRRIEIDSVHFLLNVLGHLIFVHVDDFMTIVTEEA